jgi:hypothetical protein
MNDPGIFPPLYDVDKARREVRRNRRRRDGMTLAQASIADALALSISQHFSAEETGTVGRAVLIAAGAIAALAVIPEMQPAVLCNVLAFAGERLITDGEVIP